MKHMGVSAVRRTAESVGRVTAYGAWDFTWGEIPQHVPDTTPLRQTASSMSARKRQRTKPAPSPPRSPALLRESDEDEEEEAEDVLGAARSNGGEGSDLPQFSLPAVVEFNELPERLVKIYQMLRKQETDDNSMLFQELDTDDLNHRLRDFENLAFRLSLEESAQMRRGRDLDILRTR